MFGKKQVFTIRDVPSTWILATYLGLDNLGGETIRMKSPFAPNSTHVDPLCLYYNVDAKEYRFKCWSDGKGGRIVDLMMQLWQKSFSQTAVRIEADYQKFLASGHAPDVQVRMSTHKWRVVAHKKRSWTSDDAAFWGPYNIDSGLLGTDLVMPLSEYSMVKFIGGEEQDSGFSITGKRLYGYFTPQGVLYKIYQPENRERKYLKISDYLQGSHSLMGQPYLCIASGMKDMLALKSLKLRVDYVAPDSENNLLSYSDLYALQQQHHYQAVFTLLDSDKTGLTAMQSYQERYGVPFCYLNLRKDAADSIKECGAGKVLFELAPKIQRTVEKFHGLLP